MLAFLNGKILPEKEAKISILDRGFLYGDGVFETLRVYDGTIFLCKDHIDRLFRSARAIYLDIPLSREEIQEHLYSLLRVNRLSNGYLRVSISRGVSEPGLVIDTPVSPTITAIARPFGGYPQETYNKGISAAIVNTRRIPPLSLNPGIKSLNFLNNIMARIEARALGVQEGILLNIDGFVAEGTVSNVFIVINKTLITPPPGVGILNGVTRSSVINLARENGIPLIEEPFYPEKLYLADECFITSTLYEVMAVTTVSGKKIKDGRPGEVTTYILNAFRKLIKKECPQTKKVG